MVFCKLNFWLPSYRHRSLWGLSRYNENVIVTERKNIPNKSLVHFLIFSIIIHYAQQSAIIYFLFQKINHVPIPGSKSQLYQLITSLKSLICDLRNVNKQRCYLCSTSWLKETVKSQSAKNGPLVLRKRLHKSFSWNNAPIRST